MLRKLGYILLSPMLIFLLGMFTDILFSTGFINFVVNSTPGHPFYYVTIMSLGVVFLTLDGHIKNENDFADTICLILFIPATIGFGYLSFIIFFN